MPGVWKVDRHRDLEQGTPYTIRGYASAILVDVVVVVHIVVAAPSRWFGRG